MNEDSGHNLRDRTLPDISERQIGDTDKIEYAAIVLFPDWEKLPAGLRYNIRDGVAHVLHWGDRISELERERNEARAAEACFRDEFHRDLDEARARDWVVFRMVCNAMGGMDATECVAIAKAVQD